MKEKFNDLRKNHVFVCIITSMFAVFLAWGIFVAQYFLSDVVTLARNGDEARHTLPAFIEMGELIADGIEDGVDVFTVNGSNSIHLDGIEWYLPYRIFAFLGYLTSPLLMFMLFLATHMFITMYFTQRLCHVYFDMRPVLALFVAVSVTCAAFYSVWFVNFFVIMSLVIPLIYGNICLLKKNNLLSCFLASGIYVAAFTSGYTLLSCILALTIFIFTIIYGVSYKICDIKDVLKFTFISAIVGAVICLPYLYSIMLMNQTSDTEMMTSLFMALALQASPSLTIIKMFLASARADLGEWIFVFRPGLVWLFMLIVLVYTKTTLKMDKKEKIVFGFGILTTLFIFCADLGGVLPFEKWFYMFPFFGGMHLRRRYFLIFVPLFFVSFGIAFKYIKNVREKKDILKVITIFMILFVAIFIISKETIDKEAFIVEIILTCTLIYFVISNGFKSRKFWIIFSCVTFCYGVNILYEMEEITVSGNDIKSRSVAFDAEKQIILDDFVNSLPKQKIYKYVGMDGDGSDIPLLIPGNYGWYHRQNSVLSNYLKYPLHGAAVSDGYRETFNPNWYDNFNIQYCNDTRADFVILTQAVLDKYPNRYILDDTVQRAYLNDTTFCAKLKKYIPRHYTGGKENVLDENNSLDNGYFYCPTLSNENIVKFDTNNSNIFKMTVDADEASEIQFSMFPCDKYNYYIDGKEYNPEKDYGLAYFRIPSGRHSIEIRYKDVMQISIYWIFTIYYALIVFGGICYGIFAYRRRKV